MTAKHPKSAPSAMSYYVVMMSYKSGREAIVDPEITRRGVVDRIRSGEYRDISFIHFVSLNDVPQDVTAELIDEAMQMEVA